MNEKIITFACQEAITKIEKLQKDYDILVNNIIDVIKKQNITYWDAQDFDQNATYVIENQRKVLDSFSEIIEGLNN